MAKRNKRKVRSIWILGALPFKAGKRDQILWDYVPERGAVCFLEHVYGGRLAFTPERYERFREEVRKSLCYCRDFRKKLNLPAFLVFGSRDPLTFGCTIGHSMFKKQLTGLMGCWKLKGENHYFVEKRGKEIGQLLLKYGGEEYVSQNRRI